jgi:hypothetical protein
MKTIMRHLNVNYGQKNCPAADLEDPAHWKYQPASAAIGGRAESITLGIRSAAGADRRVSEFCGQIGGCCD